MEDTPSYLNSRLFGLWVGLFDPRILLLGCFRPLQLSAFSLQMVSPWETLGLA